jgi:hypothetical protein
MMVSYRPRADARGIDQSRIVRVSCAIQFTDAKIALCRKMWKNLLLSITTKPSISKKIKSSVNGDPTPISGSESFKFVALEYYGIILNRTYFIATANGYLCGANVGSLLSNQRSPMDPNWYLDQGELKRCREDGLGSARFLRSKSSNFRISPEEILSIDFDDAPKWGMGMVPYSGRLHFKLANGSAREFILLGYQDGQNLRKRLIEIGYGGTSE